MRSSRLVVVALLSIMLTSSGSNAAEEPFVVVVRLKPGESKTVEVAPPNAKGADNGTLNPIGTGRDGATVSMGREAGKLEDVKPTDKGVYSSDGLDLIWPRGKPQIEFKAAKDAAPETRLVRCRYRAFGQGNYTIGFQVIIADK